jgi:hypothetical protein
MERRSLQGRLIQWKRSARAQTTELTASELRIQTTEITRLEQLHRDVKRVNRTKAAQVLARRSRASVFNAWVAVHLQTRRIRFAKAHTENIVQGMRIRSALTSLINQKQEARFKA